MNNENLQLYEDQPIRTAWNEEEVEWYFSIVDVVGVFKKQPDARRPGTYWAVMKKRFNKRKERTRLKFSHRLNNSSTFQ